MTSLRSLIALFCLMLAAPSHAGFAVARQPVPVLNYPDLAAIFGGNDGTRLKVDRCGQVRELEYIALPGTVFRITASRTINGIRVHQVETDDYPAPAGGALYVDSRLIEAMDGIPPRRSPILPPREEIISRLKASIGSYYVWGGNLRQGLPDLLALYYRRTVASDRERLTLAGLDCSGLLYQATNGWTPRNTSQLVAFGTGLPIAGKGADEISRFLQPLDLIVWDGHVIIVLDRDTAIESKLECGKEGNGGVVTTPLAQRLGKLMQTRRAADAWPATRPKEKLFVIRRWFR